MIISFISVDTEIKEQNEEKGKTWFVTMRDGCASGAAGQVRRACRLAILSSFDFRVTARHDRYDRPLLP
jgi:hypothetical protein